MPSKQGHAATVHGALVGVEATLPEPAQQERARRVATDDPADEPVQGPRRHQQRQRNQPRSRRRSRRRRRGSRPVVPDDGVGERQREDDQRPTGPEAPRRSLRSEAVSPRRASPRPLRSGSTASTSSAHQRRLPARVSATPASGNPLARRSDPPVSSRTPTKYGGTQEPSPIGMAPESALGAWRSLVARTVRVGEVPGSNPAAPIEPAMRRSLAQPLAIPHAKPQRERVEAGLQMSERALRAILLFVLVLLPPGDGRSWRWWHRGPLRRDRPLRGREPPLRRRRRRFTLAFGVALMLAAGRPSGGRRSSRWGRSGTASTRSTTCSTSTRRAATRAGDRRHRPLALGALCSHGWQGWRTASAQRRVPGRPRPR